MGALGAVEQLLCPLWPGVRAQAAAALRPSRAQESDLDDIAVATMMRLLAALGSERHLVVPFRALVASSVEFEVRDFRRKRARREAHEELREPAGMPELPAEQTLGPIEQTDALHALLFMLSPRDRRILIEREVLDLPAALVAERHGMSPDAVRQVCSRVLARLRRAAEDQDALAPARRAERRDLPLSSFPQTSGGPVTKPTQTHD
ncbi:MAG: RNA polymerase sigma factor [Solirubrobacteraceae bacterium]